MKAAKAWAALAIAGGVALASPAEARARSQRTGFNFGTTVRMLGTNDHTNAGEGSDKNTHTETNSQLVSPYVGYAFSAVNLGVVYSNESRTSDSTEAAEDGSTTTQRQSDESTSGLSVFARFLFGDYFYFEAGGGLYEDNLKVHSEVKNSQTGGAFTGSQDDYQVKGVGPGYQLGGGLELPISGGFYFTSSYQVRIVQLRDYKGGSNLGSKRSGTQSRELLFGLAYYDK